MREALRYGLILGLICSLAGTLLAVVNGVTEPMIKYQKQEQENSALKEVMPEASNFKPHLAEGEIDYYAAYDKGNNLIGFVIRSEGKGYSSNIQILTGVSTDLEITELKILSQNETPGLGNKISSPSFREQFKGKKLDTFGQIEAITGATISSAAVINSVRNKISELKPQLLKERGNVR